MAGALKIRGFYGGPVAGKVQIPVSRELMEKLGECMVEAFIREAKKDFAKRGWSGKAHDGSPPIWESFSYRIVGESTLEIDSTYPGIDALTSEGGVPRRKLRWLTQQEKENHPARYRITPGERKRHMRKGGRISKGERMPLVVPMKGPAGTVVFRTAPLTTQDAWIHPGIARFTFAERAARSGRAACIEVIKGELVKHIFQQDTP